MVEIKKTKDVEGYDRFKITTENGSFDIMFGGNLDLYWYYWPEENYKDWPLAKTFTISKENYFIYQKLDELYKKHGYYMCAQKSFTCEGESGMNRIRGIMETLRNEPPAEINGSAVVKFDDYETSVSHDLKNGTEKKITLPVSNVLCYYMEDGSSLIVRPSGTEPKIKMYLGSVGKTDEKAEKELENLTVKGTKLLGF